jgi:C1A family cysteine protease
MKKNRGHNVPFSRLYIYYNERKLQGTINEDSGATIREGAKTLATQGACFEINWPYVESQFTVEPDFGCYVQGKQFKTTSYHRLDNTKLEELLSCLAEGFTFVFGFTVFDSMESRTVAQTGILSMPNSSDKVLGGHAVVAVGYDLNTRYFLIRNSWGPDWGQKGCVWMPFDYLTNADLADDFWTLRAGLNV